MAIKLPLASSSKVGHDPSSGAINAAQKMDGVAGPGPSSIPEERDKHTDGDDETLRESEIERPHIVHTKSRTRRCTQFYLSCMGLPNFCNSSNSTESSAKLSLLADPNTRPQASQPSSSAYAFFYVHASSLHLSVTTYATTRPPSYSSSYSYRIFHLSR